MSNCNRVRRKRRSVSDGIVCRHVETNLYPSICIQPNKPFYHMTLRALSSTTEHPSGSRGHGTQRSRSPPLPRIASRRYLYPGNFDLPTGTLTPHSTSSTKHDVSTDFANGHGGGSSQGRGAPIWFSAPVRLVISPGQSRFPVNLNHLPQSYVI